jgi:hypothetical protein
MVDLWPSSRTGFSRDLPCGGGGGGRAHCEVGGGAVRAGRRPPLLLVRGLLRGQLSQPGGGHLRVRGHRRQPVGARG